MTATPQSTARRVGALLAVALVAFLAFNGPRASTAVFTSSTEATSTVAAASDWTAPTVQVTDPGPSARGTVTVQVTAADTGSGVASVVLERKSLPSGTWTTICTDTSAPWSCAWDTTALTDGAHALRARATDRAGNTATSAEVRTTVVNRAAVVLTAPATAVRGTVALTAAVRDTGSLEHTVRIEQAVATGGFRTLCADLRSPSTCSWDTTTVTSGSHQLRAVVVDAAGRTVATSPILTVTVDNVAPAVTVADPGSPLKGTVPVTVTATDAHSGVKQVVVQAAAAGTGAWRDLCTRTQQPWSCSVDTTVLADGPHSFRAVATDVVGHSTTSAVVTNRLVENTAPSVAVEVRSGELAGTVQVGATAHAAPGITSVTLQVRRTGAATWTDLCTDTVAPWSCDWNTLTVPNGTYELRAQMRDALNRTTHSPLVVRTVTNAPFTGVDVQTSNGSGQAGRPDRGDTVTYSFSHEVDPSTILGGWDGSSRVVKVQISDGGLFDLRDDTLTVVTTGNGPVNLGTISLDGDYIWWLRSIDFEATMVATTTPSAQGIPRTTVTLTLGSSSYRGITDPVKSAGTASPGAMVWTPSSSITDVHGRRISTDSVTESGSPLDREF